MCARSCSARPLLWGLLWTRGANWLPFLALIMLLVFWRAGLYAPRELREGPGRIVSSLVLVCAARARVRRRHRPPLPHVRPLPVGALLVGVADRAASAASYESITRNAPARRRVRRRAMLVGDGALRRALRETLGSSRGGIDYVFVGRRSTRRAARTSRRCSSGADLDELIVADAGSREDAAARDRRAAHRRGVRVRVAPKTTELLVERGEYVPGQGVPLFELRPPVFAGADWASSARSTSSSASLIVVVGLPLWLLIAAAIKVDVARPRLLRDRRIGVGEREFGMLKFRTMVADADRAAGRARARERGDGRALQDPRRPARHRGRAVLRRLLARRGAEGAERAARRDEPRRPAAAAAPRLRLLEAWHRKRYLVLPGVTGLWQISGRSDSPFDDLVRLDFYYLENWSIWLDISIICKTLPAVSSREGAY